VLKWVIQATTYPYPNFSTGEDNSGGKGFRVICITLGTIHVLESYFLGKLVIGWG